MFRLLDQMAMRIQTGHLTPNGVRLSRGHFYKHSIPLGLPALLENLRT